MKTIRRTALIALLAAASAGCGMSSIVAPDCDGPAACGYQPGPNNYQPGPNNYQPGPNN